MLVLEMYYDLLSSEYVLKVYFLASTKNLLILCSSFIIWNSFFFKLSYQYYIYSSKTIKFIYFLKIFLFLQWPTTNYQH